MPITDPEAIEPYLRDEAGYTGAADGLWRAHSLEDVVACFRAASESGTPVTLSARRTSLTGAAMPSGGWVLALDEVSSPGAVAIDLEARTATAPAQTLVADLEAAAEAAGLFFPVDPTSRKSCSIGGAVSCNASGARSFAHGPLGAWVDGLVVVLVDGTVLRLKRGEHPPADGAFEVAGRRLPALPARPRRVKTAVGFQAFDPPDLIDVFIGAEGTLGYIHEVTVRLLERKPVFAALCFFEDLTRTLDFVEVLQNAPPPEGVEPMSVELFDRRALELAAARHPRFSIPSSAQAALFVEQRHPRGAEDEVAMAWYEALLAAGAPDDESFLRLSRSHADLEAFREFRHAVPESVNALARSRGLKKLGTDLAYPRGWLHRAVEYQLKTVAEAGLDAAMFGHIGDNHLHLNLLPRDAAEAALGQRLYVEMARHCAAAGGSISGEHGIGKAKRALLSEVLPAEHLAVMQAAKRALDPQDLLGRGNVFER